jgi:hypothetical protein
MVDLVGLLVARMVLTAEPGDCQDMMGKMEESLGVVVVEPVPI